MAIIGGYWLPWRVAGAHSSEFSFFKYNNAFFDWAIWANGPPAPVQEIKDNFLIWASARYLRAIFNEIVLIISRINT